MLDMSEGASIQLFSFWLWSSIILIHVSPYVRPCVSIWEYREEKLKKFLTAEYAIFVIAAMHALSMISVLMSFHYGTDNQPDSESLRSNTILFFGYIFLLTGIYIMAKAHATYGWRTIMAGQEINPTLLKKPLASYMPYYHPFGSGCVCSIFGLSLIRASAAGLILTVDLASAFYFAHKLDQSLMILPKGEPVLPVLIQQYPYLTEILSQIRTKIQQIRTTQSFDIQDILNINWIKENILAFPMKLKLKPEATSEKQSSVPCDVSGEPDEMSHKLRQFSKPIQEENN